MSLSWSRFSSHLELLFNSWKGALNYSKEQLHSLQGFRADVDPFCGVCVPPGIPAAQLSLDL